MKMKRKDTKSLPVGQIYGIPLDDYIKITSNIFDREWYTNHGQLTSVLEQKVCKYLNVRNAIAVTNATLGLIIALEALGIRNKSIALPSFTFIASGLACLAGNNNLRFIDVSRQHGMLDIDLLNESYATEASALMAVNLWGGTADINEIDNWALSRGIPLVWDSSQAFGCQYRGNRLGRNGSVEVFSFHATKVLNSAEGGCITTDNDELAHKMRNIRSSYGVTELKNVYRTCNGRFSEFQAALALYSLAKIDERINANDTQRMQYARILSQIPGLKLVQIPSHTSKSNFSSLVIKVNHREYGASRDVLRKFLWKNNVFAKKYFSIPLHEQKQFLNRDLIRNPLPNTETLSQSCISLPIGGLITNDDIERVGDLLRNCPREIQYG